jgi:hypothetical protein
MMIFIFGEADTERNVFMLCGLSLQTVKGSFQQFDHEILSDFVQYAN